MRVGIYNTTREDKTIDEFINNPSYLASGGSKNVHTEQKYLEIIKESLPHRLKQQPFKDEPLSTNETKSLKSVLEQRIKQLLVGRKPVKMGRPTILFLGEQINLDITPFGPNHKDNFINNLRKSHEICEECLRENKPVYLSIYEEE